MAHGVVEAVTHCLVCITVCRWAWPDPRKRAASASAGARSTSTRYANATNAAPPAVGWSCIPPRGLLIGALFEGRSATSWQQKVAGRIAAASPALKSCSSGVIWHALEPMPGSRIALTRSRLSTLSASGARIVFALATKRCREASNKCFRRALKTGACSTEAASIYSPRAKSRTARMPSAEAHAARGCP